MSSISIPIVIYCVFPDVYHLFGIFYISVPYLDYCGLYKQKLALLIEGKLDYNNSNFQLK